MKTSITDIFVRRPVLALVVNILILLAGITAYKSLSVRQYPRSENSTVSVSTVYIGASAEVVRGFITTAIERSIASADGIDYIESKSLMGLSVVTARLELNYDPTKALADITAKVNQVRNELPAESEVPSISVQSADSEMAAAYLGFSSDKLTQSEITDYLIRVVQPRLAAVTGVQRADVLGARTFAMRVWLKPEKMAALNVSPQQVRQALAANNFLAAVGSTKGSMVQVNLTARTDLHTQEEFERLVIFEANDTIVRLRDVADVELGAEDYDTEVRFNGETAVFIGIFPLPNSNTIDVVGLVRKELEALQKDLPEGMEGKFAYDASEYIGDAIDEVIHTLLETLIIVIIVIFLFLGSFRSAMVPVFAIPVSLIGAVFIMLLFGFTLNLLTLLAIVLSVGIVVDDAIVVVENVERHLREGRTRYQAAIIGARELVGPVIAMTVTLAAVYTPIALQGGLTGALFREFALTLAGAVTVSGLVALTLSPMMASKLLHDAEHQEKGFTGVVNRFFDRLRDAYGRVLNRTLHAQPVIYAIWIAISLAIIPMYMLSMKELAPTEDQGFFFGIVNNAGNASADQKSHFGKTLNQIMLDVPERDMTFMMLMSPSDPMSAAQGVGGFGGMALKPWDQRTRSTKEVMTEAQGKITQIPGLQVFLMQPAALPGGSNFPVEFVLASTAEPERILEFAEKIVARATELTAKDGPLFYFPPMYDLKYDQPQSEIVLNMDKVAALGLTNAEVGADLSAALGGNYVNRFNISGRAYKVIPQVMRSERLTPDQLKNIYVNGPDNKQIPLSAIATIEDGTVARSLNRFQQLNAVKISGMSGQLDKALTALETAAAELLPPGYSIDYTGESRQLRTEGGKFLPAMLLAVLMIFLVLAVQFNSFRDPFIILGGSVPLAIFGALVFTFLKMMNPDLPHFTNGWTTSLNIYAQVGLVTLVGLIAKNGILIVEFANKLQEQGLEKLAAVKEAAQTRLRPVLMTSVATVAGHFPLTLVTGAGAEARNSIGLVLVGGMAIGTVFTLFVIPSLYLLIARQHRPDDVAAEEVEFAETHQPVAK